MRGRNRTDIEEQKDKECAAELFKRSALILSQNPCLPWMKRKLAERKPKRKENGGKFD